jgi:hypothetical protein
VSCVRDRGGSIDRYIMLTLFTIRVLLATSQVLSMLTFVYLTRVGARGESMLIEANVSATAAVAAAVAAVVL